MPGRGCRKKKGRKPRAHTPIVTESERGAMGMAYAVKKGKRKAKARAGPAVRAIAKSMTKKDLRSHLKEVKGKKLTERVRTRTIKKTKKKGR